MSTCFSAPKTLNKVVYEVFPGVNTIPDAKKLYCSAPHHRWSGPKVNKTLKEVQKLTEDHTKNTTPSLSGCTSSPTGLTTPLMAPQALVSLNGTAIGEIAVAAAVKRRR
jgi:hypothetical protein